MEVFAFGIRKQFAFDGDRFVVGCSKDLYWHPGPALVSVAPSAKAVDCCSSVRQSQARVLLGHTVCWVGQPSRPPASPSGWRCAGAAYPPARGIPRRGERADKRTSKQVDGRTSR